MISNDDLDSAVAAGVIDTTTADALRAHVAARHHASAADEEHFRLVTGFNDIFVVIASLLLLTSVGWLGVLVSPVLGGAAVAAVAWGLAEYFVRQRHMALPAIVLLVTFVGAVFYATQPLLGEIGACALAAVAAWVHWRRFQVPITVAAGAAAVAGAAVSALVAAWPGSGPWLLLLVFLAGAVVFAMAVRWDATDPLRRTRRADVAFWLHLLAAPMLVHPVFGVIGVSGSESGVAEAIVASVLYLAIGIVSLVLDRRALMVSALGYVLYAFTAVLQHSGFVGTGFAVTALAIGAGLLLLSVFWQRARSRVVGWMPPGARRHLAPVRG